jgi:hypothetical protein
MIELTEEQLQALARQETPEVLDPRTRTPYVLVRKDVYQRLRGLLEDEEDVRATAELVDKLMAADDADDPSLESYQAITREGTP